MTTVTPTTLLTANQFAHACIGAPDWPPPEPKRGARFGGDPLCWLCGGATDGVGWPERTPFGDTFTNVNVAAVPTSRTTCQPCVYLSTGAGWQDHAARHPELGVKTVHPLSWRTYSHLFSAAGHACPTRAGWRAILVEPPAPPFVAVIALSGQKHLLFRALVAHDRDVFPVQVEEDAVVLRRRDLAACLDAFEALLALGFSRDDISTGRYHPASMQRAGLRAWRVADEAFRPWRDGSPALVTLARFCAQRPEEE